MPKQVTLTNLVRTGNQMSGGNTWDIIGRALAQLVSERLVLLPLSSLPEDCHQRMKWNHHILKLVGKIPIGVDLTELSIAPFEQSQPKTRATALTESAMEFLRPGCQLVSHVLLNCSIRIMNLELTIPRTIRERKKKPTVTDLIKIYLASIHRFVPGRLLGYSDWNSPTMSVYVEDSSIQEESQRQNLRAVICSHLTILFRHIFLSKKPSRPAQSRWTGVASVAAFTLGLSLCHRLLAPLFASLTAKDKEDGSGQAVRSTDADVAASAYSRLLACRMHQLSSAHLLGFNHIESESQSRV